MGVLQKIVAILRGGLLVGGRTVQTQWVSIPGLTAAAYADEDAFGTKFVIDSLMDGSPFPKSGVIQTLLVVDEDDEDIDVDLFLYTKDIVSGTDNAAYAPTILDTLQLVGVVRNATRRGVSGVTIGNNDTIAKAFVCPNRKLFVQAVARGALNIAANTPYYVSMVMFGDIN